jgi:phage tail-like protein
VYVGGAEARFTECSNIGIRVQALAYCEGGQQSVVRQLPGRVEYASVTLRYGLTASNDLWDWFRTAMDGKVQRQHVSIALLDPDGITEVMRWNLVNAWPCEWNGTPLDALAGGVAIETLKLVFESVEKG